MNINNLIERKGNNTTYLQIVPVLISSITNKIELQTNVIIGAGFNKTLIRQDAADKLNLQVTKRTLNITNAVATNKQISSRIDNTRF